MIIAVIILYIINVIFKFVSLLIIVNGIQKYANLSNYHYVITTYDENGLTEKEECWFKDGVSKTVSDSGSGLNILCIDYNNNIGYTKLAEDGEKNSINIDGYNTAHKTYKNGGQMIDRLPEILSTNTIESTLFNSINFNIKIDLNRDGLVITTKDFYLVIGKESLLPSMLYSTKNKKVVTYVIEFNSVKSILI